MHLSKYLSIDMYLGRRKFIGSYGTTTGRICDQSLQQIAQMTRKEADHRSYPMYVELYKLLKKSRLLIPFVRGLGSARGDPRPNKGLALEAVYVGAEYHEGQGSLIPPTSQSQLLPFLPKQAYLSSNITVPVRYR